MKHLKLYFWSIVTVAAYLLPFLETASQLFLKETLKSLHFWQPLFSHHPCGHDIIKSHDMKFH